MTFDQFRTCIDGKSSGAVRVSLGLASNFADVVALQEVWASPYTPRAWAWRTGCGSRRCAKAWAGR